MSDGQPAKTVSEKRRPPKTRLTKGDVQNLQQCLRAIDFLLDNFPEDETNLAAARMCEAVVAQMESKGFLGDMTQGFFYVRHYGQQLWGGADRGGFPRDEIVQFVMQGAGRIRMTLDSR